MGWARAKAEQKREPITGVCSDRKRGGTLTSLRTFILTILDAPRKFLGIINAAPLLWGSERGGRRDERLAVLLKEDMRKQLSRIGRRWRNHFITRCKQFSCSLPSRTSTPIVSYHMLKLLMHMNVTTPTSAQVSSVLPTHPAKSRLKSVSTRALNPDT